MRGAVGALICAAFALAANPALARDFEVYGSQGTAGARDECPAGQYFVGIVGNTGSWIDQITVVCAELKPDMTFSGGRTLPSRGGSGGAFEQAMCGPDEAISQIDLGRTKNYEITQVQFRCFSIKRGATSHKVFNGTGLLSGLSHPHACQAGELATGLIIRYGQYVNGLALICGAYTAAAATCQAGMVWRESFEGDSACVTPEERFRLPDGTCRAGYVWRDSFSGDNRCVTPPERASAKANATATANQSVCANYADRSLEQVAEADRLGCDFERGDFWTSDRQTQINSCLGHGTSAASVAEVNLLTRDAELQACRQKLGNAGAAAANATVTADVDLYDAPGGNGNVVGALTKGEVVPFGGCRNDGWCEVTGRGWVWGEFLSH